MTITTGFTTREDQAASEALLKDPHDFSFVLGGPLYQLFRRAHLSGNVFELLGRRIAVISLLAWLPLLFLSIVDGRAWGSAVSVPFVADIELHVRFLVVLPLLVLAELVVFRRTRHVARQFLERGLIPPSSMDRFEAALASAMKLRNSVLAEVLLIAFVYGFGIYFVWSHYIALDVATWYATPTEVGRQITLSGWWFICFSLPLFQFMLIRWYYRIFIWIRFLWHVSKCNLDLIPTHPDRMAGLGFLSGTSFAFAPLLMAHGALLAGSIANQIFYQGATLLDFKMELVVVVAFLLLLTLGPLLLMTPHLTEAKRTGTREYGVLAQRYVRAFDEKWLRGGAAPDEALIGSGDIQSLADLGNSFQVIKEIRPVPITRDAVIRLTVVTLLPLAPLLLTMVSMEELVNRLLKVVF